MINNFLMDNLVLAMAALVLFGLLVVFLVKLANCKMQKQIDQLRLDGATAEGKLSLKVESIGTGIETIDRELKHCMRLYENLYSAAADKVKDEHKAKGQGGNKYFTPTGKIKKRYVKQFSKYLTPKGKIKKNYTNDSAAIKLYEIIHEA